MIGSGTRSLLALLPALLVLAAAVARAAEPDPHAAARVALLQDIAGDAALTAHETGRPAFAPAVLQTLADVPRHAFVPPALAGRAYENRPLPIGHGQTISQPYIVALMTDLLRPKKTDRVLEIGTGSGYQAAVLAKLVDHVYTLEIVAPLAEQATKRLAALGYANVTVKQADGYYGWSEHGPYDGIVVTAAAASIPPALVQQLKPGGRLVIPVGAPFLTQQLVLVEKSADGSVRTRQLLPVRFVPLTGEH